MLKIGLTGGIGSGKSAASAEFERLGITVVDADVVAREVVEPGTPALEKIREHFGDQILLKNGSLDRAALRTRVFADAEQKHWLESLLHPLIREEILIQLRAAQSPYVILVSPLMFETDQHELVDRTLLIDVPETLQLQRASRRDNSRQEDIQKIIDAQMSRQRKLEKADDIICNDANLEDLHKAIRSQHAIYLNVASAAKPMSETH